ncbi:MAG: T9SS type A sorting domain-containing protein [Flavobacteriales bacterium]|nr:T9SS type A sorting domain-containing protein [Flavobacteriales bacterium]
MKKLWISLAFTLVALCFYAQTWTHRLLQYNYSGSGSYLTVTMLDYDADGTKDILYGNTFTRELFLLRNNESHFLQPEVVTDSLYSVKWLHGFEYNNDGLEDYVISANTLSAGEGIWIAVHQPDHTFQWLYAGYAVYEGFQDMYTLDMDGDNDIDIVYDDYANSNVIWTITNNGDDTFTQNMISYTGQPTRLYGIEDLDEDGDLDMITSYYSFTESAFMLVTQENNGNMQFTAHENFALTGAGNGVTGDFDGDGLVDLLHAPQQANGTTQLYLNNGDLTLSPSSVALGLTNYALFGPAIDFENDGDLDFIVTNDAQVLLKKQNSNGSFSSQALVDEYYAAIDYFEDINQDGYKDLIAKTVDIWYGTAAPEVFELTYTNYNTASGPMGIGHLSADNNPDMVLGGYNGQVTIFNQRYDELIEHGVDLTLVGPNISFSTQVQDIIPYDRDDDGDMDILCTIANYIFWLVNEDGVYTQLTVSSNANGYNLWIGDLDNDGKHDILYHTDNLNRWEWTGASYTNTNFGNNGGSSYEVMDCDNDGDSDILYFGYDNNSNTLVNYLKNNNGTFTNVNCIVIEDYIPDAQAYPGNQPPMTHADIDNDGDDDLIYAATSSYYVACIRNEGNDQFTPYIVNDLFESIYNFMGLAVGDLDNDNDVDIVATIGEDSMMQLLMNDGTGAFTPQDMPLIVAAPRYIEVRDMDNDNDNDIAFYSPANRRLEWLKNGTNSCDREYSTEEASICPGTEYLFNEILVSEEGIYADTLIAASGCDSIHVLVLDVYSVSNLAISRIGNMLTATSGFATFEWLLNDQILTDVTANTLNAATYGTGIYTVNVTDNNGCTSSATYNVAVLVGIEDASFVPVTAWPVPFHDELNINFGSIHPKEITLTDMTGRIILKQNSTLTQLNTDDIAPGNYQLIITDVNGSRYMLGVMKR